MFKRLHVPDVVGMPTLGEVGAPWFFSVVETLFGAYDPVTHRRHINEVFILVPKKNGKSSNAGALAITTLICNYRPAAEFLFVAPTKMIAPPPSFCLSRRRSRSPTSRSARRR